MTGPVGDFKLSITTALADQLAAALARLTPAPLTSESLVQLESRPGVYELFLLGERVYVGKAKSSIPDRLGQHRRKISGRRNIDVAEVTFKCLYVDEDLDSASPERLLINAYSAVGANPWNNNGFGNKDPGRRRDETAVKAAHFDAHYPIDLDVFVTVVEQDAELRLDELIDLVKTALPYNLRRDKQSHVADLQAATATLPGGQHTARELINLIVGSLPVGWQATALPGYVILYRERDDYPSADFFWRKDDDGHVVEVVGRAALAPGGVSGSGDAEGDTEE